MKQQLLVGPELGIAQRNFGYLWACENVVQIFGIIKKFLAENNCRP